MDTLPTSSSKSESDQMQVLTSKECETIEYIRNDSDSLRILEDLQSLRINEDLCDIRLETNDGTILLCHKNVLMAESPYFREMFGNFYQRNKDLVKIREFSSSVLRLLVDYIYSGQIIITRENVQVLLPAANILQLDFVIGACAEFLKNLLDASNCFGIKAFAHSHNCPMLLSSSEEYIKKHYLEVANGEDFLSLFVEDVIKIISCNDLAVPFEEKVFESIIKWVRHDLEQRKDFLPELMEHIRLPLLASMPDILNGIIEDPLLKNSPKCKNYIFEALRFNPLKSIEHFTIPQKIRCKSRLFGGSQKVILIISRSVTFPKCYTEWYDPVTKVREDAPEISECLVLPGFGVIRDKFVYSVGILDIFRFISVSMLDVSSRSPSWVPMVNMSAIRDGLGVGVLDNCIYAVGGINGTNYLKSVEVFNVSIQNWQMVSSMSTARSRMGDPTLDKWTPVSKMSVRRGNLGVGVLDNAIYAIGGYNGFQILKSAEKYSPSDGVWSTIPNMHLHRDKPGVVALDGLLYVFGGDVDKTNVDTLEIYNPSTNTWSIEPLSKNRTTLKEIEAMQTSSSESESVPIQVLTYKECEPTTFRNNSHSVRILEGLQSLRKNEVLCDIRFETDDGAVVSGHKNVLIAGSPYFRAMFNNFDESNKDLVKMRKIDSAILRLLLDFIYTGKIKVSEENVLVLLPAANILQLDFVNGACADFLQKQLDPTNCLGIKSFADLHNCTELLAKSEKFIKEHYLRVVKSEDFLSLSVEDMFKLVFCNDPLSFDPHKSVENFTIPGTTRSQLRISSSSKVILIFQRSKDSSMLSTELYEPITQLRKNGPMMNNCRMTAGIGVIKDTFVFVMGGVNQSSSKSVSMLDVSSQSPSWVPIVDMLVSRNGLGVGVLDNCIYAVGGHDGTSALKSVELFNIRIQQWKMVSSMSTARISTGVGVLNNCLYAVGGYNGVSYLKSIECYDPRLGNWTRVAEMSAPRDGVGVGVLNGVIYAVGGYDGTEFLKRAEIYRPSDGVWSTIANMPMARNRPGVVALGGLLYVFGEHIDNSTVDIVQIYSPKTNTWSLEIFSRDDAKKLYNAVAVNKPSHFFN
ncbi:hypothetical protein QTP88_028085 [Uroleucon formosanum]